MVSCAFHRLLHLLLAMMLSTSCKSRISYWQSRMLHLCGAGGSCCVHSEGRVLSWCVEHVALRAIVSAI